ncbi:amidohydrolase family protein [Christiangramia forsetii]|uniref:Amidohydrolase family protein n=2 Tax=Christiangramia forsetii TaxID=411153 RepID=A0M229_CHRFK|nr:amidohydrolase family protein [Christiangramia forsetii]GGG40252.1 amidohydrolase [Christiangramia forsetii]CAL66674.1 amidohydrolase family protein [Christiangramia forsetii KT0803]
MKIDAHQHFWKYNPEKHSWISDDMKVIQKDFLPEDLKPICKKEGIAGCVVVQADQTEDETNFLLDLAEKHDFIKAVVGWIDLRSPDLEERLEHYRKYEKLKGFRHVVQDEPDVNFMKLADFQKGIASLEKYGFTYDILIFPSQMEAALATVKKFPKQKFVIDHIAKPDIKNGKIDEWKEKMKTLASHKNVYCKVSGMVTEADLEKWEYSDFAPYLDVIFDGFGSERIMFGSDWPVCLLGGSYSEVKGILENYIKPLSEREKEDVWGRTAQNFYDV